ncbi:hypothetical protein VH569_18535 [Azospirillum sp. 11R-A]|uniref:hypothetical protein n=1 Tax=Azospirillum sp. 11R-A TaxID=3111634 RepID=UPI003C2A4E28
MTSPPRIETVSIDGTVLTVGWQDGTVDDIDIAGWLATPAPAEADILKDPEVLAKPHVAHWGTVVAWDESGDVGIDHHHLRLIAAEQRPFGPGELVAWQSRMGLSNQAGAALLGVGISTFHTYKNGTTPIPPVVKIACRAIEKDPVLFQAHYKPVQKRGRPRKAA